jgi:DNA-binding NtrC family response regulator
LTNYINAKQNRAYIFDGSVIMPKEKALVVDDHWAIRYTLTEALRAWGCDPLEASTVAAALESFDAYQIEDAIAAQRGRAYDFIARLVRLGELHVTIRNGIEAGRLRREVRSLAPQALERSEGNQTRAAELVGVSRDQLSYRLKKLEDSQPGR